MTRFVDTREAEVAVLAYFAVLGPVNNHGFVSSSTELRIMSVCNRETDGLASEPIALIC
jgi:hypothetical protein